MKKYRVKSYWNAPAAIKYIHCVQERKGLFRWKTIEVFTTRSEADVYIANIEFWKYKDYYASHNVIKEHREQGYKNFKSYCDDLSLEFMYDPFSGYADKYQIYNLGVIKGYFTAMNRMNEYIDKYLDSYISDNITRENFIDSFKEYIKWK